MSTTPTNHDDVIDSRDVIARIEELQEEREAFAEDVQDCDSEYDDAARKALAEWDEEHDEELEALLELQSECEGYSDWAHGETLIRDSHFETYAEELAEEIGAINPEATWPNNCIDWERAARELQWDYVMVSFDGVDYWIRNG